MKTIPLTRGMVAIVDDADYEFVNQWKWYALCCKNNFYAARSVQVSGRQKTLKMHRILAGAAEGQDVDHKDRCTLNNQRCNLRICNNSQNQANKGMLRNNTSGFKGVSFNKNTKRWRARLTYQGQHFALGYFDDKISAAQAYDVAAKKAFGDFSLTNERLNVFPEST